MNWVEECATVIPCFNEAGTIENIVTRVRRELPHVIVVDDGSHDTTAACAASAGAEVVRERVNAGKGAALAAGWRRARASGFAWAMTLDGDGQHAPEDIPAFFPRAEATGAALVIGDRMDNPGAMPWLRRQVNRWMSRRLSRDLGVEVADSQCGFRLVDLRAWERLPHTASRFEVESELLVRFVAAGCAVASVPVRVIYETERSKIHPLLDTWRWFRWWFAHRNLVHASLGGARDCAAPVASSEI